MDSGLQKKIKILMSNVVVEGNPAPYRNKDISLELMGSNQDVEGVTDDPSTWELNYKQAELLVKLYQQLSSQEQKAMLDLLKGYLDENYRHEIVMTAVLTLVHTDNSELLVDTIISEFNSYNQTGYIYTVASLIIALKHKPNLFSEAVVEKLYDWVDEYYTGKNKLGQGRREWTTLYADTTKVLDRLHDKCNIILSRNFAVQIESAFNPELNADEAKVIETIEAIGFPVDLSESLRHINDLVQQANKPMKYRDCISAIRAFTERLYERIAKELEPTTRVDGKDSEEVAKLFKKHKLISTDMASLLVSARHFLSNEGAHRLKSRKEDARIAKNITVELSLYLLTRLREHQADTVTDK